MEKLRGRGAARSVLPRAVGHRRHIGLVEYLVRHFPAKRLKQRELPGAGFPWAIIDEFWNTDTVRS